MRVTVAAAGEEFLERRVGQVVETKVPVNLGLQCREALVMQDQRRDRVRWILGSGRHAAPAGAYEGSSRARPRVNQKLAHTEWLEKLCGKSLDRFVHQRSGSWHFGLIRPLDNDSGR